MNPSVGINKDDNENQGDHPTVKCSSWLLHDKVASVNQQYRYGDSPL